MWDWQKYHFIYDLRSCNINSGFIDIQSLLIPLNLLQLRNIIITQDHCDRGR